MKIFAVAVLLVAVSSLTFASKTPAEVEAEVQAYVQSQVSAVVRKPSLARAGGGLACYDKYIPLITAATEDSKTDTAACVSRAAARREDELNKVKDQRAVLENQVKAVQDALDTCSKQEDVLNYLTCLRDNSQLLKSTVEQVSATATSLANGLSAAYASIDNAEDLCIQTVIDKVKADTDALTVALQNCLMNGFDDPKPESTSEASVEPSAEPSAEPSTDEPSETSPAPDQIPNENLLPEEQL